MPVSHCTHQHAFLSFVLVPSRLPRSIRPSSSSSSSGSMDAFFALYPLGSILFFRKVFLYSMVTGVTMMVPVSLFVYDQWESRQLCDRVLRGYHTTRSLMFICQLPLRCRMLRQLAAARELPNRAAVVNTLITMLHSRSWKFNQITGIISYLLFGFGLVFAYTGSHCSASSPMLYRMLIISLVVFIAQTICSCLWSVGRGQRFSSVTMASQWCVPPLMSTFAPVVCSLSTGCVRSRWKTPSMPRCGSEDCRPTRSIVSPSCLSYRRQWKWANRTTGLLPTIVQPHPRSWSSTDAESTRGNAASASTSTHPPRGCACFNAHIAFTKVSASAE